MISLNTTDSLCCHNPAGNNVVPSQLVVPDYTSCFFPVLDLIRVAITKKELNLQLKPPGDQKVYHLCVHHTNISQQGCTKWYCIVHRIPFSLVWSVKSHSLKNFIVSNLEKVSQFSHYGVIFSPPPQYFQ